MELINKISNNYLCFLLALLCYILFVIVSKLIIKCTLINKFNFILFVKKIYYIVSIDYLITKLMKKSFEKNDDTYKEDKTEKGKLLTKFNCFNIITSIILMIISVLVVNFFDETRCLFNFVLFFMIIRFFSRIIEIILSFILDIFDENKGSNLNKNDRMKLAFISILEVIITAFICIYFINYNSSFIDAINDSIGAIFYCFSENSSIKLIQLFEAISFYSLIILYITEIGEKSTNKNDKSKIM